MAREPGPKAGELFRVREAFAVPGGDGFMRTYAAGALIDGGDPIATSHRALLEPASSAVEKASAEPGERRSLGLRLPSGQSLAEVTAHRTGHAHETGARMVRVPTNVDDHEGDSEMVHALPPEHPDSPASVHAPDQPARGVVADDVPDEQNPAGGEKAADVAVKEAKRHAKESGDDLVKVVEDAAKVAKTVAEQDAKRAEDRQPRSGSSAARKAAGGKSAS